jgi:ATP-GRASP peptide maturase of grasp-with-spasm system
MIRHQKNTVIIFSECKDVSTNDVIDFLFFNKTPFYRFNDEVRINKLSIQFNIEEFKFKLTQQNRVLNDSINNVIWYRRGLIQVIKYSSDTKLFNLLNSNSKENNSQIQLFIDSYILKNNRSINSQKDNNISKIDVFYNANKLKINTPKTLISNEIEDIIKFAKNNINTIIKDDIFSKISYTHNNKFVVTINQSYNAVKLSNFENINFNNKCATLFQEYIPKKYEIRTFYLKGQFRSMAIFSQQNEKTKTDFRNYDYDRPNRNVPYNLPKSLEKKLHKLMLKLDINCGSMDIIVTPDDEYYFLEVNPIGQFQWLSKGCNYFIERMIAEDLAQ